MSSEIVWDKKISDVNDGILKAVDKPHAFYYAALAVSFICLVIGAVAWGLLISWGIGVTGLTARSIGVSASPTSFFGSVLATPVR